MPDERSVEDIQNQFFSDNPGVEITRVYVSQYPDIFVASEYAGFKFLIVEDTKTYLFPREVKSLIEALGE